MKTTFSFSIFPILLTLTLSVWGYQPALALATSEVGQVTFVVGQVRLGSASGPLVKRGQAVRVGDALVTANNGHVHVRFVDGAIVSARPDSRLVVADYYFDVNSPKESRVRFELEQGVVRSVTGQAGQAAKDRFRLNTPVAALGVRGTDFAVYSSSTESIVTVNTGAVVVSGFGVDCSRSALGPCAGPQALELRPEFGQQTASVQAGLERPKRVPVVPEALRQALALKGTPQEAKLQPSSSEAIVSGGNPAPLASASTGEESSAPAPQAVQDALTARVQQDLSRQLTAPPSAPNAGPPELAWGHWGRPGTWTGNQVETRGSAAIGRSVTVGNSDYVLYRAPSLDYSLPREGTASFGLQFAQVHWTGGVSPSPGQVTSGSLNVDFASSSFSTSISGNHSAVGLFSLVSQGSIGRSGDIQGLLISDPSRSDGRVSGALTSGGREASYLFEKTIQGFPLVGVTSWKQ